MTDLYLLEPDRGPEWFPFSDCRPVAELRAGAWLVRERWEAIAEGETRAIFAGSHLQSFVEDGAPPVTAIKAIDGPAIIGCSAFAPSGAAPDLGKAPARLVHEEAPVGWWVPAGQRWEPGKEYSWPGVELEGIALRGAHDLVTALELLLAPDTADFLTEGGDALPDGCIVVGDPAEIVLLGATIEPGVVFDTREGAVVIEQGSYVKSGTRLDGPVYIGPRTDILGGPIRACAIGPRCKVRGEVSNTVFVGFSNKAHDGFVGHSVVGRWVNLGAGTTTSNLKNTYGKVRLQVGTTPLPTERQYLGSLIGDHVKTAIGTMFGTGTVVGVGANVFGEVRPPKYVMPFAWGGGTPERMDRASFVAVAERVLGRRDVTVSPEIRQMLESLHQHAAGT